MKVLAVFAHPSRDSFTGALLDSFAAGLQSAGHAVDVADLYREGFDGHFGDGDFAQFEDGGIMPADVLAQQARVDAADALAFVFPVWWWSFPAILKGWVDRVFSYGYAYANDDAGKVIGLLRHRKAVMLAPASSSRDNYRRYGYHGAMQRQLDAGIFGFCGIRDVQTFIYPSVEADAEARDQHLAHAREVGRTLDAASGSDARPLD